VRLFSELLEENNIHVIGNGFSGKNAVSLYLDKEPDVVLIDIMMSDGSGIYAIKKIREINPNAKIIVVTADNTLRTEEKLSVPLITKPFKIEKIVSMIN
jgi:DNA-binding NarL/FixJ family response regulator